MTQQPPSNNEHLASSECDRFASQLGTRLKAVESGWLAHPHSHAALLTLREDQQPISLNLTPFIANVQPADAQPFFDRVSSLDELLKSCDAARQQRIFEADPQVHPYAKAYLAQRFEEARTSYSDQDARLIANWVKELDLYAAVKSVESLLDDHDNLALFYLAREKGWRVHFDHLAIRCGTSSQRHAEAVIELLQRHHGYVQTQVSEEKSYQFDDGWNAYPLYKMLDNGQVIRLFIDQSNANSPRQIIQHWNRAYGFTAHHLALRVTRIKDKQCLAVPLREVITALATINIEALQATGFYTHGLLEQVFIKPHRNPSVPEDLKRELASIDTDLARTIENGKLIELVSRRELPEDLVQPYFALYNLSPNLEVERPSAPMYSYFLPAQAAHVILTSMESNTP